MGLFTSDVKIEDKTAPVKKTAQKQLEQFIKRQPFGTVPKIPTQEIAGLSPLQQEFQRLIANQVTGEDYNIASDVFRTAAQQDVDPTTSPEFTAFRQMADRLKTEGQTDIRQRAELGGQLKSTPAAAVEAEAGREFDTALLQELARIQRQNQQDKLQAAAGLTELGTRRLDDISAANVIADQERAIEQARNDAIYQQAISTVLFPYQEQLQLFSLATGQTRDLVKTGGGLTDLGFGASLAASAFGGGN